MKNIKNKLVVFICSHLVLLTFSCSDFMEYEEDKAWTDELVWTDYSYVKRYLASIYHKTPGTFDFVDGAFLAASTDDAEHANLFSDIERFNSAKLSAFNHPNQAWLLNYKGIRLANSFIENSDTLTFYKDKWNDTYDASMQDLSWWRGEARFLKAYFYFELIKRYGGVPIVDEWVDEYTPVDPTKKSFHEVVDYIAATCDEALLFLRDRSDADDSDLGHATKGAAIALKVRTFLYAASPLNNPDGSYDRYLDSCAFNASLLFDMGYDVEGVAYANLFTPGSAVHLENSDVIFDKKLASSNSLEKNNYPIGFEAGKGLTNPSQELVDAFEMSDGTAFDWNNAEHAANPYANRDPRLYETVIFNGTQMNVGNANFARKVEVFEEGLDAPVQEFSIGTRTGYYLKKYIHTDLDFIAGNEVQHNWFLFRYAEVLLSYAEAMNQRYNDPDVDPHGYGMTARDAVNQVRARAGMPEVVAADADEFRTKLRNERRVELAFENHRHWDVRRWNIGEQVFNTPIHGVDVKRILSPRDEDNDGIHDENADGILLYDESFLYTIKQVEERVFENHMNRYPIPRGEVYAAFELEQNTGW